MSTIKKRQIKETDRQFTFLHQGGQSVLAEECSLFKQQVKPKSTARSERGMRPLSQIGSSIPPLENQDSRLCIPIVKNSPSRLPTKRFNQLLGKPSPFSGQQGNSSKKQNDRTPHSTIHKSDLKRMSSQNTAATQADSKSASPSESTHYTQNAEMSAAKSGKSTMFGSNSKQNKVMNSIMNDKKRFKRGKETHLVGKKRDLESPVNFGSNQQFQVYRQINLHDQIERAVFLAKIRSSAANEIINKIILRNKKSGEQKRFACVSEADLKGIYGHAVIQNFDMKKLEIEYDYDTDTEQIQHAQKMQVRELTQAIDFYVVEDPLKLVDNLKL